MDNTFREIIPCKYMVLSKEKDFFIYSSNYSKKGIISGKTFKEIIPSNFDKIKIHGMLVKAWSDGHLYLYELDASHKIKNTAVVGNVVSVQNNIQALEKIKNKIDQRLLGIGWYYDTTSVIVNKKWSETIYKWGLKNKDDSILVAAQLPTPKFIENTNFSLVPCGNSTIYKGSRA